MTLDPDVAERAVEQAVLTAAIAHRTRHAVNGKNKRCTLCATVDRLVEARLAAIRRRAE